MSNVANLHRTKNASKPIVIALHCSGATCSEWRQLERDLGHRFSVIAPDLIGSGATAHWTGTHVFRLSDEAAKVIRLINETDRPVHLVGHSYGGCVALRVACELPTRVVSMALYEPVAFHILKVLGLDGRNALQGINVVVRDINRFVSSGDHVAAATRFFEYWSGEGGWASLRDEARNNLVRYIPKVCLEFAAGINERTPLHAYRRLNIPTLLLHGEHSSQPLQLIAQQLAKALKFASPQTAYGAGHMGPFSHAEAVSAMITDWIVRAEPGIPAGKRDVMPEFDRVA